MLEYSQCYRILILKISALSSWWVYLVLISKHLNVNFGVEHEEFGSLSLLDVKVCRKNSRFVTYNYKASI